MKLLALDYNSVAQISSSSRVMYCYYFSPFDSLHSSLLSGFGGVFFAVGYHSCEEQQRCGGGGDEGVEAAEWAAGVKLARGRGSGWCQCAVGKIHHQEGG